MTKNKILLLMMVLSLLILLPKTLSVSISAKITNTSQIKINNEPPYFFQNVKLNPDSISFIIKKDCSNVTRTAQVKLSLSNFKGILTDVSKMNVNGSDVTNLFKKISTKWQRNFTNIELPCGMAYQIEIFYSKNELPVYNITFGETSSSLEVIVNTDITIDNGFGWWVINKDGGNPTSWYNLGYKYMYEGNLWEWTTDTEVGDASIFASSTVNVQCFANGNHSSFSNPVMTRVYCLKNGGTSTKDFTFYSNSNATDVRTFINVGLNWRVGAQVTASGTWSNQCYGSATNSSPASFGSLVKTYCGFWELSAGAKGSVALMWKRNYTSYDNNFLSQSVPPFNFIIGQNASGTNKLQSGTQEYVRYMITGYDSSSASNQWAYIQKENSKFEDTPTIKNITGGCYNNYLINNNPVGSSDVFVCNPSSNNLDAEITPNGNTTKIWFDIQNFTSTDIFIYNSTAIIPPQPTDLWLRLKNYSGDWYYYNTTRPFLGCSGNYNNTKVNTGWTCNNSGVQDYGINKRLFLYLPVDSGTLINVSIRDQEMTTTTTTSTTTTTPTTSTTIYIQCASFENCNDCIANYPTCSWCEKPIGSSCMDICNGETCILGSCFDLGCPTTTTTAITTTAVTTTTARITTPTTTTTTLPIGNFSIPIGCCPISTFYCSDENTLMQYWNYTNNDSWYTSSAFKYCHYGCDNKTFDCNPSPYSVNLNFLVIFGALAFIILIIIVIKQKK